MFFVLIKEQYLVIKKIGFKEIGIRREGWFMAGKYFDLMLMDMTAKDFSANESIIKNAIDSM